VSNKWSEPDFSQAVKALKRYVPQLDSRSVDLEELDAFSSVKKIFFSGYLKPINDRT
jgi:hypothetical protein